MLASFLLQVFLCSQILMNNSLEFFPLKPCCIVLRGWYILYSHFLKKEHQMNTFLVRSLTEVVACMLLMAKACVVCTCISAS